MCAAFSDAEFEGLLESVQDDYDAANRNWKPPQGTYTCQLADLVTGTYEAKDTKKKHIFVQPVYMIVGSTQYSGKLFRDRLTNETQTRFEFLRRTIDNLLTSAELGMAPTGTLSVDLARLAELKGKLYVSITTAPGTKNPNYINITGLKVVQVDMDEPADAPDEAGSKKTTSKK